MHKFLWQTDRNFQFETKEKIDRLQEEYVVEHVNYCLKKSPFYSKRFGKSIPKVNTYPILLKSILQRKMTYYKTTMRSLPSRWSILLIPASHRQPWERLR